MRHIRRTHELGKQAADVLGAIKHSIIAEGCDYREDEYPLPVTSEIKKDELIPSVKADNETVTITQRNYKVRFYVRRSASGIMYADGLMIWGWPDNEAIEKVLDAWDEPVITEAYRRKIDFLERNPGFRRPTKSKAAQKRVHASQID